MTVTAMQAIYKQAPGPRGRALWGSALELWRDGPRKLFADAAAEFGDVVRFRFGPSVECFLISNPTDAQHVLQKNNRNYLKGRSYDGLRHVLGNGLVTSEGDFWRRQRKLAQPAFHRERLQGFVDTMVGCTEHMLARWRAVPPDGEVDLHAEMMSLTLRIVVQALFGTGVELKAEAFRRHVPIVLAHASRYTRSAVRLPTWLPTPGHVRLRRSLRAMDAVIYAIIAERRSRRTGSLDMLDMLIDAVDELDDARMNDEQLRDEVITMIGAGHETTASALTFVWHLLARHGEILARLQREVAEVLGEHRTPTLADLAKLEYTEQIIQETMRLYPSVWNLERQAIADDELGGYHVPAGAVIAVCPYTLHRNPRLWTDPEAFDPDRFSRERCEQRGSYDYLPFSAGPRGCIGKQFAMLEAKIVLAMVARSFHPQPLATDELELTTDVTLRPKHGLRCTLRSRL